VSQVESFFCRLLAKSVLTKGTTSKVNVVQFQSLSLSLGTSFHMAQTQRRRKEGNNDGVVPVPNWFQGRLYADAEAKVRGTEERGNVTEAAWENSLCNPWVAIWL
jgi:hypothetical protein